MLDKGLGLVIEDLDIQEDAGLQSNDKGIMRDEIALEDHNGVPSLLYIVYEHHYRDVIGFYALHQRRRRKIRP